MRDHRSAECSRINDHLHAYVEGEADAIRARLVEEHLRECAGCRQMEEDLHAERLWIIEAAMMSPPLSDNFPKKVMRRIERAEGAETRRKRRGILLRGSSIAVAAGLLFAVGFFLWGPELVTSPPGPVTAAVPPRNWTVSGIAREKATLTAGNVNPAVDVAIVQMRAPVPAFKIVPPPSVIPEVAVERRPNLSHILRMAEGLAPFKRSSSSEGPLKDDPCRPDPNKDGQTDINDVAYSCQLIMVGGMPQSFENVESKPVELADCDDLCYRA